MATFQKSQSSHDFRKSKGKTNFTTLNYHHGMNNSSFYKAMVTSHLLSSANDNHVLNCASTSYGKAFRTRSLKASPTKNGKNNNPQFQSESVLYDERSPLTKKGEKIHSQFNKKLEKKPMIQNELRHSVDEKRALEKRIGQLRKGINDQKKKLTKLNILCDQEKNKIQDLKKETGRVEEINRDLGVQIEKINMERHDLREELKQRKERDQLTKRVMKEQRELVQKLKKYNLETQVQLRRQNKQFNKLKDEEIKEIRKMVGINAYKVQLEEQKALLLNQVDSNYAKNLKSRK